MPDVTWHDFNPTSDDDHACVHCGVIAADEAVDFVSVACPVPACEHPANEGSACVIVMGDDGPECSYCERAAALNPVEEGVEVDEVEVDEDAVSRLSCDLALIGSGEVSPE